MKKTVITYGTFDLFHVGHLKLLQRQKQLGDRLIVGISTDSFNKKKGKKSIFPYEQRKEIVENIKCVDMVFPEENWEQKTEDIIKYNASIFSIGDDWEGKFDHLEKYCKVLYLSRTKKISTTKLKQTLNDFYTYKDRFAEAFSILERIKHDIE